MSIQVAKYINKEEKNRIFINFHYLDGNGFGAKILCQEYQMLSDENNYDEWKAATNELSEHFCLEFTNNGWIVYFSERGIKTTNEIYSSEEEACQFIYKQLCWVFMFL